MRSLALLPILLSAGIAAATPPSDPYEPPPPVSWECSLTLYTADSPSATVHPFTANAASAEACAASLYDQVVDEFGAGTYDEDLTFHSPDGTEIPFWVHPEWVDYFATEEMRIGIWNEEVCDDTDGSPSDPPAHSDRDEPAV